MPLRVCFDLPVQNSEQKEQQLMLPLCEGRARGGSDDFVAISWAHFDKQLTRMGEDKETPSGALWRCGFLEIKSFGNLQLAHHHSTCIAFWQLCKYRIGFVFDSASSDEAIAFYSTT